MKKPNVELLAPAGGPAQCVAALKAGADAVFFGTDVFTMREHSESFSRESLSGTMERIHEAGARGYLTLNTLVFEREIPEVDVVLDIAAESGVDAVIAADVAVISAAQKRGMEVHLSTQLSISNSSALAFWMNQGIRRVVLAREVDLQDITDMREKLKGTLGAEVDALEFEVFAHGAMCTAVSGRCFMSGFETGRSASRGDCAQSCRRSYRITPERGEGEGFELDGSQILSSKDLCTLPFLDQLLDAGVASLKIEGRNRSADYVYEVVSAYRQALDVYENLQGTPEFPARFAEAQQEGMDRISQVYHRGFSSGFYMGRPIQNWTADAGNHATHRREYLGRVVRSFPAEKKVRLRLESGELQTGDEIFVEGPETGFELGTVKELRREREVVSVGQKGEEVDWITDRVFHKADKVYRYREI